VDVYNLRGELVRRLVDETRPAGRHEVVWNGVDASGRSVASGTYLLRMRAGAAEDARKITLLK
jgi:flagellar hook assembly protein FlgD